MTAVPKFLSRPLRVVVLTALTVSALVAGQDIGRAVDRPPALERVADLRGTFTLDDLRPPPPAAEVAPAPLPTPVAPPADPYAYEPHVVLGTIEIPRLGLFLPLNQGISLMSIDRGPSHWPGTALPGEPGNTVVAGHRVTHGGPFRNIDQLQSGDSVIFTVDGRRSTYVVTGSDVVTPDAMHIVDQTPEPTATLFACHPPGSAKYRYVVRLALAQ